MSFPRNSRHTLRANTCLGTGLARRPDSPCTSGTPPRRGRRRRWCCRGRTGCRRSTRGTLPCSPRSLPRTSWTNCRPSPLRRQRMRRHQCRRRRSPFQSCRRRSRSNRPGSFRPHSRSSRRRTSLPCTLGRRHKHRTARRRRRRQSCRRRPDKRPAPSNSRHSCEPNRPAPVPRSRGQPRTLRARPELQAKWMGAWALRRPGDNCRQDTRHCLWTGSARTVGGMSGKRTVGSHLKSLRVQRGLSQERLAEEAGLSRDAIARIERGDRAPRVTTLNALAEALQSTVADVLAGSHAAAEPPSGSDRLTRRVRRLERALAGVPEDLADRIVLAVAVLCRPGEAAQAPRHGRARPVVGRRKQS